MSTHFTRTKFNLLTLSGLPILLYQGKKVRKHTLRLAAPTGARSGVTSEEKTKKTNTKPFNLLILGDSAAEGVGVKNQQDALLGQITQLLAPYYDIHYQLIANTGDTTADVITHLKRHIANNTCVNQPDLVVISTGVNDVTTLTKLNDWQTHFKQLTHLLENQLGAKQLVFTAVPPMQYFPALPAPLNTWLGLRANMLNNKLQLFCAKHAHIHFLELGLTFDPEYMAEDGFHPSKETYTKWAEAVVRLI